MFLISSNLRCWPLLVPQIAGMGDPPEMMSWSEVQVWSVAPGCATTKLSKSSLKIVTLHFSLVRKKFVTKFLTVSKNALKNIIYLDYFTNFGYFRY